MPALVRALVARAAAVLSGPSVVLATMFALTVAPTSLHAQGITSSGIEGTVLEGTSGKPAAGVTVVIVHDESGSRYETTTRSNGRYNITGLRPGGPYTISVTEGEFKPQKRSDVYLELGTTTTVDLNLSAEVVQLQTLVIEGERDSIFGDGKVGTGTSYRDEEIENIASVRRSVQDIARLDSRIQLLSLDQGGQMSAQGQNFRYNSFLIDGVEANDPFGLNSNGFSSLRSPIPMEAVQSVSVELSPYDVRRAGFTGALINAVTKSGTNEFHGMTYYEYTDQDMRAKSPVSLKREIFKERTYGFNVGGPILRDKIFFFLSYDDFQREAAPPSANFIPDAATLQTIVARAKAAGNYDAGDLTAVNKSFQKTYIAKLDWNITHSQRLSLTYRKNKGQEPIFGDYTSATTTSLSNHWYQVPRLTDSYTGQIFSMWSPNFHTEASVSYTKYDGSPSANGTPYPSVQVDGVPGVRLDTGASVNGSVYLGTEVSRQLNVLKTKNTNARFIADYSVGDHTLTAGVSTEVNDTDDRFVQNYYGTYRFSSPANWIAGTPVATYTLFKPLPGRTLEEAYGIWKYTFNGIFIQDSWKPNSHLTLTGGLRYDYPVVNDKPTYNAAFDTAFGLRNDSTFDGNGTLGPRVGFTYDFGTERKMQVRGGFGLFQGRNPGVWVTNAYQTTGATFNASVTNPAAPFAFNPDPATQTAPAGTAPAPNITVTDPNFRMPSIWKSNLAIDRQLPIGGLVFTAEFNYNSINKGVYETFLNFAPIASGPTTAPDGRLLYNSGVTPNTSNNVNGRRRILTFADVFYLTNTSKGMSRSFSLSLARPMREHLAYSISWTNGKTTEVSPMTSSTASSNYSLRAVFNPNEDVASIANYNIRDRIVAQVTREIEFIRNAKTTIALIYEGRSGRPYSWVFRGDANGDGYTFNDLLYVPTGPNDPKVTWASTTERDSFFAFVDGNELGKYKGRAVPRNSAHMPWLSTVDIKVTQQIPIKGRVKAEVFCNLLNAANLIDKDWGILEEVDFSYKRAVASATYVAAGNGGLGSWGYSYNSTTLDPVKVVANDTPTSRWQLQIGARVKF